MIPSILAAQFAKPLVKWGSIAGGVAVLLLSTWAHGCSTGKEMVQQEWDASLAQAAANAVHESMKAAAMSSAVVQANDQAERVIEAQAETIKKEVVHHARKNPKPLATATVAIYDRLIGLPNQAGRSLPSADSGPREPEVSRGGLAAQATTTLQDAAGTPVELTNEELAQAAVDFAEKYALMKNAYKDLSDWNDRRERLELDRLSE